MKTQSLIGILLLLLNTSVLLAQQRSESKSGPDILPNPLPQFNVDKFINKVSDRFNNPDNPVSGYQFTLSKNGNLYYSESDGFAIHPSDDNGGTGVTYTTSTRQNISSISKFLTTIILANVLEEYGIAWDEPVSKYLHWSWVNSMAPEHNDPDSECYLSFEKLLRHQTCIDYDAFNRNGNNNSGGYPNNARMDELLTPEELNTGSLVINVNSGDVLTYNIDDYRNGNFALARILISNIWISKNTPYVLNNILVSPITAELSADTYLDLLNFYIYHPLNINAPIDNISIDTFHNSSPTTPWAYQFPFNTDSLTCSGNLGWQAGSNSLPHSLGSSSLVLRTEELAKILAFFAHDNTGTIISEAQRDKILSDTLGLSVNESLDGATDFGYVYMKRGARGPGCNNRGTRSAIMIYPNGYELSILTNCRFNQFDSIAKFDFEDSWQLECNAFVHVTGEGTVLLNRSKIDKASTNNIPEKLLFVTHDFTRSEQISPSPLGVFYDEEKWWIFNQNSETMTTGKRFNVFALDDDYPGAFKHTHVPDNNNLNSHISVIDHPLLNNNPDAKLLVTQNFGTVGGVGNNNAIGTWYNGTNWTIFNQDFGVMPQGAMFNVLVDHPNLYTVNVSAPFGSFLGIPFSQLPDQNPLQLLFTTNTLSPNGQFNDDNVGVWYTNDQWFMYNENGNFFLNQAKVNVLSLEDCECCGVQSDITYEGCTNTGNGPECETLNDTISCVEDFVLFLPKAIHPCEYVETEFTTLDTASFNNYHRINTFFTATNGKVVNNNFIGTTVLDIEPPSLIGIPGDTIVNCVIPPIPQVVTANDNCTPNTVPVFTEEIEGVDCNYKITRTWTAEDALGNSNSASYIIYSGTYADQDGDGYNILIDCDDTNPDDEVIEVNDPITESTHYKAIDEIVSTSQIDEDVDVIFQAGTAVTLDKNFEVENNATFLVHIETCEK